MIAVDRERVVARARTIYQDMFAGCAEAEGCIYWAHAVMEALKEQGREGVLNAGTAAWQCSATQLHGYWFEPEEAKAALAEGRMSSLHAWVMLVDGKEVEVIDVTSGFQKQHDDYDPGYELPDYLWFSHKAVPKTMRYIADENAIHIAQFFLEDTLEKLGSYGQCLPVTLSLTLSSPVETRVPCSKA